MALGVSPPIARRTFSRVAIGKCHIFPSENKTRGLVARVFDGSTACCARACPRGNTRTRRGGVVGITCDVMCYRYCSCLRQEGAWLVLCLSCFALSEGFVVVRSLAWLFVRT